MCLDVQASLAPSIGYFTKLDDGRENLAGRLFHQPMTEPAIAVPVTLAATSLVVDTGHEVLGVLLESLADEFLPIEKIMGISAFVRSRFQRISFRPELPRRRLGP